MKRLICIAAMVLMVASVSEAMARELTANEKELIIKAVKVELADPGSAKFKWVNISSIFDNKPFADYCVLVNAKGKHGVYDGFKPYLVMLFWGEKEGFSATVGSKPNADHPKEIYQLCAADGYTEFKIPK